MLIFIIPDFGKSLESDLKSDTSGNFRRLLVSLCAAGRDQSGTVNRDAAARDAVALFKAGEFRMGTDESVFNEVFCQRNYAQLKLVCCDIINNIIIDLPNLRDYYTLDL